MATSKKAKKARLAAPTVSSTMYPTAEEFLAALSVVNPTWDGDLHNWIFRGHANHETYELIPSALRRRPEVRLSFSRHDSVYFQERQRDQIEAEYDLIRDFFESVDLAGLHIPGDSHEFRTPEGWRNITQPSMNRAMIDGTEWPPQRWLPLLALAQHYGVPTRLLDWTANSRVSAYFAAKEAAQWVVDGTVPTGTLHLAVWALNQEFIYRAWPADRYENIRILMVHAPRASNPNLHAQGGLFTLDRGPGVDPDGPTYAAPLDDVIRGTRWSPKWFKAEGIDREVLRCFTLPIDQAPRLLRLLAQDHLSARTVYPGFSGAVEAMKEARLWDR